MIPSVYVIGGAGSGKSTFMAELLQGWELGPLEDLWAARNKKNVVTLRGHQVDRDGRVGMYLGCMRDRFPGTDGLDRASSPVGEAWLEEFSEDLGDGYDFIVGEGATLATRRFLFALQKHTDLLLVHLHVEPLVSDLRFLQRGSNQDPRFVQATETRSSNLLVDLSKAGVSYLSIDSSDPEQWAKAQNACKDHLSG